MMVLVAGLIASCGGSTNENAAINEAIASCEARPGSNEAYCTCAVEFAFGQLNDRELQLMNIVSSMPQDSTDAEIFAEVSEQTGLRPEYVGEEFRTISNRIARQADTARSRCARHLQ